LNGCAKYTLLGPCRQHNESRVQAGIITCRDLPTLGYPPDRPRRLPVVRGLPTAHLLFCFRFPRGCTSGSAWTSTMNLSQLLGYVSIACWLGAQFPYVPYPIYSEFLVSNAYSSSQLVLQIAMRHLLDDNPLHTVLLISVRDGLHYIHHPPYYILRLWPPTHLNLCVGAIVSRSLTRRVISWIALSYGRCAATRMDPVAIPAHIYLDSTSTS
jgi:hypothetical protein